MEQILKGKKLLYLGGISRARWVVMRARELGIYVIVADYNEDSPAKAVADEAILVDAMNVEALVAVGHEKKIDGVMTGYCDILLPVCREVAKRLSLPCYMTEDMIKVATDKGYFKEACSRYDVPVPQSFNVDETDIYASAKRLAYPVFIKPMDASGSRGASACYSPNEFYAKYSAARTFSKTGRVSVEECLNGVAFILDYILVDGKAFLLSMADCYADENRPAAVNSPNLMILPSKNIDRYLKGVNEKVEEFFDASGYKNGVFFFQGYANDEKITFYEAGCRLGGTWPYIDEFFYGINPMDMLFSYSTTGKMSIGKDHTVIKRGFDGYAAIIYFLSNGPCGHIENVKGVDIVESLPYVVNLMQYYYEGDNYDLQKDRLTDVRFLSVHLVAENFELLCERIKYIYGLIDFEDEFGKSLLSPVYDVDKLVGYARR